MILDFITLADAATYADGKVNIMGGGISRINLPEVPFALPQIVIVARFIVEPSDVGRSFDVGIELRSPEDALVIPPVHGSFVVEPHEALAPDEEQASIMVANVNGLRFDDIGTHTIHLSLNDEVVAVRRLPAVLIANDDAG